MKFTLSWLKDHLETQADDTQITKALTNLGLGVEEVSNPKESLQNFIIAEVQEVVKHPNADKLKVCQVSIGSEKLQVVCGAGNVASGMKVVLARPGATIPKTGITLKQSKIRDVESYGMLCSATELGEAEESEGILTLHPNAPVGESYAAYKGSNDTLFELEITPNRGDCLGVRGIARDLSATGLGSLKELEVPQLKGTFKSSIPVYREETAETHRACPIFSGRFIRGVKNKPSPDWLRQRLEAVGVRSHNALVDITNYMAYTFCRPMHVFDADKLYRSLTVRFARKGEKFQGLDEKEHILDPSMLVVSDERGPVSVAGILGGTSTGCTLETTNVFLESAFFDPVSIAMAGRKLGVLSDSRYRFERGVDPALVLLGLDIATQMIVEICGGEISEKEIVGQEPFPNPAIPFDPLQVKTLSGVSVSKEKIKFILKALGFEVREETETLQVTIPSWRFDIHQSADLVEEIARVVGYDSIEEAPLPAPHPAEIFENKPGFSQTYKRRSIVRRALAARGFCEVQTWSFLDQEQAALFGGGDPSLILMNPISQDLNVMRPSLLPNLIKGAGRNKDRGLENTTLFEVGAVYAPQLENYQEMRFAAIRTDFYGPRHWHEKQRPIDIFDIKADLFTVLGALDLALDKLQLSPEGPAWFHPKRVAQLMLGPKNVLGTFGEIHPQVLQTLDISCRVVAFEISLDRLPLKKEKAAKKTLIIPTLQPVHRDLAFIVGQEVTAERVFQGVKQIAPSLIAEAKIFDVYEGPGIEDGKKSIAFTVTLTPFEKTLTDEEINTLMHKISHHVCKTTGGTLRS